MGNVPHRDRDQRRPNGNQKVYDFGHCCAPPRVNCAWCLARCLAELAIQFCDFSCDFVPMIWEIAPPPARGFAINRLPTIYFPGTEALRARSTTPATFHP
jgi:hypothetical protein